MYQKHQIIIVFDIDNTELPVYVTNYRGAENEGKSDNVLAHELLELAECGAEICDVMGAYFDIKPDQMVLDTSAIDKQMKLIRELHLRGAKVLMSSHIMKFTPAEKILEIALEPKRRMTFSIWDKISEKLFKS